MCGIVGYIGDRKAFPILVNGLKRLEYRGYDSSGVALAQDGEIAVYKKQGMVVAMEEHALANNTSGSTGIAHTRWATHGQPSDENAHPHVSNSGDLVLVHNGIIENYQSLKDLLKSKGYTFHSETDTEVLVNFIEYVQKEEGCKLRKAVRLALTQVPRKVERDKRFKACAYALDGLFSKYKLSRARRKGERNLFLTLSRLFVLCMKRYW